MPLVEYRNCLPHCTIVRYSLYRFIICSHARFRMFCTKSCDCAHRYTNTHSLLGTRTARSGCAVVRERRGDWRERDLGTVASAENAAKRMKPNRQLPMAYILNLPYVPLRRKPRAAKTQRNKNTNGSKLFKLLLAVSRLTLRSGQMYYTTLSQPW